MTATRRGMERGESEWSSLWMVREMTPSMSVRVGTSAVTRSSMERKPLHGQRGSECVKERERREEEEEGRREEDAVVNVGLSTTVDARLMELSRVTLMRR